MYYRQQSYSVIIFIVFGRNILKDKSSRFYLLALMTSSMTFFRVDQSQRCSGIDCDAHCKIDSKFVKSLPCFHLNFTNSNNLANKVLDK